MIWQPLFSQVNDSYKYLCKFYSALELIFKHPNTCNPRGFVIWQFFLLAHIKLRPQVSVSVFFGLIYTLYYVLCFLIKTHTNLSSVKKWNSVLFNLINVSSSFSKILTRNKNKFLTRILNGKRWHLLSIPFSLSTRSPWTTWYNLK